MWPILAFSGGRVPAIMPRRRRASPQPLGRWQSCRSNLGMCALRRRANFLGTRAIFPADPRLPAPKNAEHRPRLNTKPEHRGSTACVPISAALLHAKSSRTRIRDWPVCPARHRRFSALRRLCKSLDSLSFMGRSPWFRLSHNSTHPSAKELVFFVSRLGVTTHERTELRLWRGLP